MKLLKTIIVLLVLGTIGFVAFDYFTQSEDVVDQTIEEQPQIQMIPVLSEEQKEIEAIKKRPDFRQKQSQIEDLMAQTTHYTERKAQIEQELADIEVKLEELRAKELELGF